MASSSDKNVADGANTLKKLRPALKDLVIDEDTVSFSGRAFLFRASGSGRVRASASTSASAVRGQGEE